MTFGQSPLVAGWQPYSRSAADFSSEPWDMVLAEPEIRVGRKDTNLYPKGALTLALLEDTKSYYKASGRAQGMLGAPKIRSRCCRKRRWAAERDPGSSKRVSSIRQPHRTRRCL